MLTIAFLYQMPRKRTLGNLSNEVPRSSFMKGLSLCNIQFVFCGLEVWRSDLDGDLTCFILRLNDDDRLATERLRRERAE